MKENREYIVLSASGEDRVGLVEELSERISRFHGNIEDSRMALLGGEFSIIMLISGKSQEMKTLTGESKILEKDLKLSLRIKKTTPPLPANGQSYRLETVSPDSEGLVFLLSSVLKKFSVNIEDMKTGIKPAPWTGTPMFHIKGTIVIPPSLDFRELRDELTRLEGEKELDIFLKPL